MGSTWKWAILAAVIEAGTMCSAQPVGRLADVDARACLARSYSVIPRPGSASVDPNEPEPVDYSQTTQTSVPNGKVVVSYVALLALSSAVMAAVASFLVLVIAGIVTKVQESPAQCAVSSGCLSQRRLVAKELPAESVAIYMPFEASDCLRTTPR